MEKPDRKTAPPVKSFSDINLKPEQIRVLGNGIEVHSVNDGDMPLTKITMLWDGGEADYPSTASEIMASTLQEATRNIPAEELADIFDFCGAKIGGSISNHHVALELVTLNAHLDKVLPLLALIAEESAFPENAVDSNKQRRAAQLAVQQERVSFRATREFHAMMQGEGHPLLRIVTPEDFINVTRPDVLSIYEKMRRSKLRVFIGGNMDDSQFARIIKTFEGIRKDPTDTGGTKIQIIPYRPMPTEHRHIDMPTSVQSAVVMGLPTIGRLHPDYIPLRLTLMALGGYFGSRLMKSIREEKGLTYGINAALLGTQEGSFAQISAQCDPRYVNSVISETIREIDSLRTNPPKNEELNRIKLNAWNSLASAADSVFGTIGHYITHVLVGTPPDYFKKQLDAIAALSSDTIANMADTYLREDKLTIVTAGR